MIPRPGDNCARDHGTNRWRCADFCDLPDPHTAKLAADQFVPDAHGPYCVSRPVAREINATLGSLACDLTVDLATDGDKMGTLEASRLVRLVIEPEAQPPASDPSGRFIVNLAAGGARSLATALQAGADQCEQIDRHLARDHSPRQPER